METTYSKKILHSLWAVSIVIFLYLPILCMVLASFSRKRYFSFPVEGFSSKWYFKAFNSLSVQDVVSTSLIIATVVALISVVLSFFGALAFARYEWRGRKLYQKIILLPIFFPQAVLSLALLLWFNYLGIIPSWKMAIIAHLVWVAPIATLIVSIQAYSLDPALEDAAFDLGATRLQVIREITLPILAPGIFSGALFAFLLSWGNFPLSLFTTGADSTLPEWLYAKIVGGYTQMVPVMGSLSVLGAFLVLFTGYLILIIKNRKSA